MLTLTQAQLEFMGEVKLPAFFERVVSYIHQEFPDFQQQHQVDLTSWVSTRYFKAKSYKISTEKNHIKFINYACIFGENFDESYPFAKAILTSDITENSKMADLKDAFIEELNRELS